MNKSPNNNTFSIIVALVISIMLWFIRLEDPRTPIISTESSSRISEQYVEVLPYGLDDKTYVLTFMYPNKVKMKVRGKTSQLASFFQNKMYRAKVNLSHVKKGERTLPLDPDVPLGVEAISVEPSTVTVRVETLETEHLLPSIVTVGKVSSGCEVGLPEIDPMYRVEVTVPESQRPFLYKVEGVVDVTDAKADILQKKVKLKAYDIEGNEIKHAKIQPNTLPVRIPVYMCRKKVPLSITYTGSLPAGLVISQNDLNVKEVYIYGKQDVLKNISVLKDVLFNLSDLAQPGIMVSNVKLNLPPGIVKADPSEVQFHTTVIQEENANYATQVIKDVPIEVMGNNMDIDFIAPQTKTIDVHISGTPEMLKHITKSDIELKADVSNLSEGEHKVELKFVIPPFVKLAEEHTERLVKVRLTPKTETIKNL